MSWLVNGSALALLAGILYFLIGVREDQRKLTAEVVTLVEAVRELTQVIRETKLPPTPPGPRLHP